MLLKAPLGRVIKLDTWGQTPLSTPPQNCDQDERRHLLGVAQEVENWPEDMEAYYTARFILPLAQGHWPSRPKLVTWQALGSVNSTCPS